MVSEAAIGGEGLIAPEKLVYTSADEGRWLRSLILDDSFQVSMGEFFGHSIFLHLRISREERRATRMDLKIG